MTTEELLEELPRRIKKDEVLNQTRTYTDENECLLAFLHIKKYDISWQVSYESLGRVLYLGTDDDRDYATFGSESLNTALQNMHDWCVKHKLIQL